MGTAVDQFLQPALKLPGEERLQLISALVSAAEERGLRPFDDSWLEEVKRRSAEFDAKAVTPVPWAVAKERAR